MLANFSYRFFPEATRPELWFFVEERRTAGEPVRTPATEFFTVYKRN